MDTSTVIHWVLLYFMVKFGRSQEVTTVKSANGNDSEPVGLKCYHCISQLPIENINEEAQVAFKQILYNQYNIPPSHPFCNDADAYEFGTVEEEHCMMEKDQCAKLKHEASGLEFVIRGCLSTLYNPPYKAMEDLRCTESPPYQCFCTTSLCNANPLIGRVSFSLATFTSVIALISFMIL